MDNLNPGKKEYNNKPQLKRVKFPGEELGEKDISANELSYAQRGAIATFSRMLEDDLKQIKAAQGDKEVLKEIVRKRWRDIVIHGSSSFNRKTRVTDFKPQSDLDGDTSIDLLQLAGIDIKDEDVRYVSKGKFEKGKINIDTGDHYGFLLEDNGETVFLDHHGSHAKSDLSGTKITYEALVSLGLLKKEEYLDKLVEFVNQVDNMTFPDYQKYYNDYYRNLLGLYRSIKFPELLQFFKDGKTPTDILTDEELVRYKFIKTDAEGHTTNASAVMKKNIDRSLALLDKYKQAGFIIPSERYGNIVVDIGKKIPGGFEASRAVGAETYIMWGKETNGFFISTARKITDSFSQGIMQRNTMLIKVAAGNEAPLNLTLKEVLEKFTDGKLKPTGDLAKYLNREKRFAERKKEADAREARRQAVLTPSINMPEIMPQSVPVPAEIESSENTAVNLSSRNKGFFKRMSETGKKIVNHFYKHLSEIPSPQMVIGKMKIAYNKFWHDKNKKKADALKAEVDRFDLQIRTLAQSENEISAQIENMKKQDMLGIAAWQLRLRDITQQKNKLLTERNHFASKHKIQADSMGLYENKLDRISGSLIENYNAKVKPIDARMRQLQQTQNRMDLISAVTTAKHNSLLGVLAGIEKRKTELETSLRSVGLSEREIKNSMSIKVLEQQLVENRAKIKAEIDELSQQEDDMNLRLAPVIDMAQFFKAKKDELASLRQTQPYQVEISARRKEAVDISREQIKSHAREDEFKVIDLNARRKSVPALYEISAETNERPDASALLSGWNEYLKKMFSNEESAGEIIDKNNFLGETMLTGSEKFSYQDFKNILGVYCRVKNIPTVKLKLYFDKFIAEKSAQEKEQQKQAA